MPPAAYLLCGDARALPLPDRSVELKPEYIAMAARRTRQEVLSL